MADEQPSVHQAMAAVMHSIGAVKKSGHNEHFNYNFRGIDDVLNAVHPALVEHGVHYVPQVESAEHGQAGKQRVATLRVRYVFYGPAGDSVEAVTCAEGMDSGDKAPNKAMSAALKYALIQVFAIPTVGDDPDSESPDTGGEPVREQVDLTELETVIAQAQEAGIDVDADKARAHASQSVAHRDASVKALSDRIAALDNGQPEPQGASA